MKEIKAFIHRNRAADVVRALTGAGHSHLSVADVKGTLDALDTKEREYSIEIGEAAITEVKIELVCEDARANEAIRLIRENGRTGQRNAGWIYVSDVSDVYSIDGS